MPYIGRDTDKLSNVEVLDNITFDGSSSYTLQKGGSNFTPSSANTLLVSIDGVVQAGNFTVSGSTIDFGTAVAGTSTCDFILHYGVGLITTPADGTVTNDKINYPLAKSGATVSTFNRTTDDGDILELQKDGTAVGSIGVNNSDNIFIGGNASNHSGIEFGTESMLPRINNTISSNSVDLGNSSVLWKNIYLSGGLYVGGTGSANYLDDYEEGTWTPSLSETVNGFSGAPTPSSTEGKYTKIGRLVYLTGKIIFDSSQSHTAYSYIDGLPFSTSTQSAGGVYNTQGAADGNATGFVRVGLSSNRCSLVENDVAIGGSTVFLFNVTYIAD